MNSGNACYHSVQNLLSSRVLLKNLKSRIYSYKTVILPVVLYGCETWSLTLLRVFKNRVLRRTFGLKTGLKDYKVLLRKFKVLR
jgi:hypothetical protein